MAEMDDPAVDRIHRGVEAALSSVEPAVNELVVAVSGGPDSLTLFHALLHLREPLGLELYGAHLDHGLRWDAGADDAAFATETFEQAGLPYTTEKTDVASYRAAHRLSLEEAAREVRYAFLARVCREQAADAIALGHTADDQAETILMHIVRGSGLTGLRGMEASSVRCIEGADVRLVRPLLRVSRADTEAYCQALGIQPRTDESNRSPDFTRNRVRAQVLPLLEELNPGVRAALLRLSTAASRELSYLDAEVDRVWESASEVREDGVVLDRNALSRLELALLAHLMRRAVATAKGDLDGVRLQHIEDMMRLLGGQAGQALDLPGGLRFRVGYDDAVVTKADVDICPLPVIEGEHAIAVPGETIVGGWQVVATLRGRDPDDVVPLHADQGATQTSTALTETMGQRALTGGVTLRSRRPGDRVQPLGMTGHKKLQDFMVDAKVPEPWRDRVPLLVAGRGIAWVAGWRIAEWARVGPDDRQVVEITLRNIG